MRRAVPFNRSFRRRGTTLIETAISLGIVAVVVVGSLETLGAVHRYDAALVAGSAGHELAQDLLGEIVQAAYRETAGSFGRETGETSDDRRGWDDVDDYNGWSESPPTRRDGAPLAGLEGWTRSVAVHHVDPLDLSDRTIGDDTGLRRITVTVTSPTGTVRTYSALRAEIDALQQAPTTDRAYVHHVGIEVQGERSAASRVRTGVNVLNHRPPPGGAP